MESANGADDRSAERERMIAEQLVARGIRSQRVLDAIRRIPREWFVLRSAESQAYADSAMGIECGQTISQPYMVARMSELLELGADQRVLEIGTGSGYQAAVLACLTRHVYTVEWHLKLMTQAAERLERLGLSNVKFRCADGSLGWREQAPFDAIIVTAGAPQTPAPLVAQLAVGGRLVVPVGGHLTQTLVRVRQTDAGPIEEKSLQCRFVKLRGEAGWHD